MRGCVVSGEVDVVTMAIRPQPHACGRPMYSIHNVSPDGEHDDWWLMYGHEDDQRTAGLDIWCPLGKPGDTLAALRVLDVRAEMVDGVWMWVVECQELDDDR